MEATEDTVIEDITKLASGSWMRAKSLVKNRSPWTNRRVSDITTTNQNTSNQIDKGSRDGARQLHASSSTLLSNKEGHEIGRQTSGSLGTETVEQTHPGEDGTPRIAHDSVMLGAGSDREHTPLNTELERKNKGHNSQPLQQSSNMPFGEIADPVKKENFHGKGSNLNHMGHEGNIGLLMSNDELDIESAQAATSTSHSSSNNNMHVHTKGKKGGWKRLAHDIHKVDTIGLSEVLLRKRLVVGGVDKEEAGEKKLKLEEVGNVAILRPANGRGDVAEDPVFTRDGADVYVDSNISFTQAILGGKVDVPTLSGKVQVNIPKGVQPGQLLLLRGKGLPKHGFFLDYGDQYVRFRVNFPTSGAHAKVTLVPDGTSIAICPKGRLESNSLNSREGRDLAPASSGGDQGHGIHQVTTSQSILAPDTLNDHQRAILEEFAKEEINNVNSSSAEGNCHTSDCDEDCEMDNRLYEQLSTG
ncbi:hypothetical protein JRO89_XS07G0124800 [Xanthoceras sorbifolium]|uniref:Chaperone DnaJ C-terminal domain-containing protein n=1 Tax=Xanthoceras sorbifolium TaxID=99658 RepID=A0ABQ8HTX3_9ROSI|nr:hypothetical protein JRO89_XS07G0124800 [Xanthoceras sorbifolium]